MNPEERQMLAGLSRARLLELARDYGIAGLTNKAKDQVVSALAGAGGIEVSELLGRLNRDELKQACRSLSLDDAGREKAILVERLKGALRPMGPGRPMHVKEEVKPIGQEVPTPQQYTVQDRGSDKVQDYRHAEAKRKNNPEVGLSNWEPTPKTPPRQRYQYDPFLDPQLQWTGKAERLSFDVDAVSLHIHERVSTQAIVKAVKRNGGQLKDQQLALFADPQLPLSEAVEFYQHDVNWANRLILGDSLLVMNSLLQRELMVGQVQMIYMDPPYGVNFKSNFQPTTRRPDPSVQDKDENLTREPEQIKAYRDTWTLGTHSYLTYLRDRLLLCRELLSERGSIFVQIGQENVHYVRSLMGEIFGEQNFVMEISFKTKIPLGAKYLAGICDYLLWYAKEKSRLKFRRLWINRTIADDPEFTLVDLPDGTRRRLTSDERSKPSLLPEGGKIFRRLDLTSTGRTPSCVFPFQFEGRTFYPTGGKSWKTNEEGMNRLAAANRIVRLGDQIYYVLYYNDFPILELANLWDDTAGGFSEQKIYVVETNPKVIQRCMLMSTDPGDLVLDPTCGSGTTAYVAEQWGRRWITCDTSRVALALARQRLLSATFDYYQLAHPDQGVDAGFTYEAAAHITLGSIAQNHQINVVSDDDARRQEKIEQIIREGAEPETLYDKPLVERGKVRVSGPFTVESIPVAAIEDPSVSPIEEWDTLPPDARADDVASRGRGNAGAGDAGTNFVLDMIAALKKAGINRIGGGTVRFSRLNPVRSAGVIQAEGELEGKNGNGGRLFGVCFGPRYGPVTLRQVEEAAQEARGRYDGVVVAGFTFDAPAQEFLKRELPVKLIGTYINPDVLVGDLLKTSKASQIFTLFGKADIAWKKTEDGYIVEVGGVDVYDPQTGEVHTDRGEEIAAWFVDTDYDDRCFNICQAFFPGGERDPWDKLSRALRGTISEEAFEALRGLKSLPFGPGRKIAVKVIDHRGNEMLEVFDLSKIKEMKP